MRLTIAEMKNAFAAGCNRKANLSLGLTYFQPYEIAMYLNEAYMICMDKRLGVYDERYVSVDMREKVPPVVSLPNNMKGIIEMGTLYSSSGLIMAEKVSPINTNKHTDESSGSMSLFFRIPLSNGFLPYILSCNFSEFADKKDIQATLVMTCKPVAPTDIPRLSMVYNDDRFLQYLYYRIRNVRSGDIPTNYIEVVYTSRTGATDPAYAISYDYISYPKKITAEQVKNDSKDYIEVAFGFDIISRAVQIAMESIGAATQPTTLQTIEAKTAH